MRVAWAVELLKFRRSPVTRTAGGAMVLIAPFFAVGAALLVSGPGGPDTSALAGAKIAGMVQGVGWGALVSGFGQVASVLWLLGVGIVAAWCCGREYADRTLGQLLGLPTPIGRIASAKVAVVLVWSSASAVVAGALAVLGGLVAGLGAPSTHDLTALGTGVLAAVASGWLALPFAWLGTVGRGYLPAVGALLGVVMVSQVAVLLGGGSWFPWAVPALLVGAGGPEAAANVSGLGVLLVVAVGAVGWGATVRTWSRLQLS